MRRIALGVLAALGLWGFGAAPQAHAQFGYTRPQTSPFNQPAVSPYMNLARGGNPALNYNTLVRPQIDTGRALQQLQSQMSQDQQQILMGQLSAAPAGFDPSVALPLTGHPVQFQNYAHYYTPTAAKMGSSQPTGSGGQPLGARR